MTANARRTRVRDVVKQVPSVAKQLKGANGHVYNALVALMEHGECSISHLDLAMEIEYSITAVTNAIRWLEHEGLLIVEYRGPGRQNRYTLPPSEA